MCGAVCFALGCSNAPSSGSSNPARQFASDEPLPASASTGPRPRPADAGAAGDVEAPAFEPTASLPQASDQCGPQGDEFDQLVQRLSESLQPVPALQCGSSIWQTGSTALEVVGLSPTLGRLRYSKRRNQMSVEEESLVQGLRQVSPWNLCPAEGTQWSIASQSGPLQTERFVSGQNNIACEEGMLFVDAWAIDELVQSAGCWFSGEGRIGRNAASAPRIAANSGCDYAIAPPASNPTARSWLEVSFSEAGAYLIETANCPDSAIILAVHDPELAAEGVESPAAVSLPTACASLQFELQQPTVLSLSTQLLSASSAAPYALTVSRLQPDP